MFQSKDEKNVRRRVYDALNVLIASGIIIRSGKVTLFHLLQSVKYDPGVKFQIEETGRNKEELSDEIIKRKEDIARLREEINKKRAIIKELKTKKRSVKNLIQRNKLLYNNN